MTVIDEALVAYLKTVAGVTALVSTRIYGMRMPQTTTLPCVTTKRIDTPRVLTMDSSGSSGDLVHPRFQIDCWDITHSSVKGITDAIRAALHGKTGSFSGITIRASLANEEVPEFEPETNLYRGRSEYIIWFQE